MANEITATMSLKVANGSYQVTSPNIRVQDDQATIGEYSAVVDVGTTAEEVPTGDVASEGWWLITNLDSTNFVDYGPDSAGTMIPLGRLGPGKSNLLSLKPGVTVKWQADTAACKVKMILLNR
jgi:hypothetical protein